MRDLLTGLAILLIVALTTMLVAPYFVDWNGQRGFIEAQLTRALGQKVTVGGAIDLKLLPTPYLRLNQTVIGDDEGAFKVGIRYLDLELSVAPLLHGEFDIVEGRLEEPTVRVALQADRTLPALPATPALRAVVRLERIKVVDGTLAIADPQSGRTFVFDHLDFGAEAPSLAGPFKGSGRAGAARTRFRFSTTEAAKGKAHLRFAVDETPAHPGFDLDGELALRALGVDKVAQSFDGTLVATGHVAATGPVGWRLAGRLAARAQGAALTDGELRIGGEDGLSLHASGDIAYSAAPSASLALAGAQLDVDRLSGPPVNGAVPPPPHLPGPAALRRLLAAATPPIPTDVSVKIDGVVWGGEALSALQTRFTYGPGPPRAVELAGAGPGGLDLHLAGALSPQAALTGHLDVAADDLPAALRWLGTVAPDLGTPRDAPVRAVRVAANVEASDDRIALRDLRLGLDGSVLTGSAMVAPAASPPRVSAELAAGTLAVSSLPDLHDFGALPFDAAVKLEAATLAVRRIGQGPLDARGLHLEMAVAKGTTTVSDLRIEDLGGARIAANGRFGADAVSGTMRLDAARLDGSAALFRQLAPGPLADAFAARAGALAPAHVDATADLRREGGRWTPARIEATAALAQAKLDVRVAPNGASLAVQAQAQSPDGGALLRQTGIATVPVATLGASRIVLAASGPRDGPLDTKVDATFGATALTVAGRFTPFAAEPQGSGTLALRSPDAIPLLQATAIVPLDDTGRLPAELTAGVALGAGALTLDGLKGRLGGVALDGTLQWRTASGLTGTLGADRLRLADLLGTVLGPSRPPAKAAAWSSEPFAAGLNDPPRVTLTLHAAAADLGLGADAQDFSTDLVLAPNLLALSHGAARYANGRLSFDAAVRRDGPQASLEGHAAAADVALDGPALAATLTGRADFAGSGLSALALVSSLAGSGDMTLARATLPGINPYALPETFAAAETDALAVDEDSVRRAFSDGATGHLDAGNRRFALGLAGGRLTATPSDPPIDAGPIAVTLQGSADLRQWSGELRVGETLRALPKDWTGPPPGITVTETGLPRQATRSFDVNAFINGVAARAIARESARIEVYEFDVRERALFNARLQADRRREQDRLKAEADAKAAAEAARAAEAERRAKAEAARLDRLRDEQNKQEGRNADAARAAHPEPAPAKPPNATPAAPIVPPGR